MANHSHLSIGEVLSLLQDEFPDVTISKIRFLESQGLVDPERTPSGYRKFYDQDIERLRWVLRQQRDAFLPLKVIKGRLDDPRQRGSSNRAGGNRRRAGAGEGAGQELPQAAREPARAVVNRGVNEDAGHRGSGASEPQLFDTGPPYSAYGLSNGAPQPAGRTGATRAPARASQSAVPASEGKNATRPEAPGEAPSRRAKGPAKAQADRARVSRSLEIGGHEDELGLDELVALSGADPETVKDLQRFGLITPRAVGGAYFYNRDAATIARLASAFARHGVEARHLRAYKGAAEREAGMVEQVIMPLLRQRNPEARLAAVQAAEELAQLGGELRSVLLKAALADLR